jgi:hypothetical protein
MSSQVGSGFELVDQPPHLVGAALSDELERRLAAELLVCGQHPSLRFNRIAEVTHLVQERGIDAAVGMGGGQLDTHLLALGMSGGPLLDRREAKAVGVVVGVYKVAPFSIVVPSTVACFLIESHAETR